jgi:tetratricopeptide (TPR) repeat protein
MKTPANLPCERLARAFPNRSFCDAARRTPVVRPFRLTSRLFLTGPAVGALSIFLWSSALPAQSPRQPKPGNANDAPGWPITSGVPGQGSVAPDPTIGLQQPQRDPREESCSQWTVAEAHRATVNAATLQIPDKAKGEYGKACFDLSHGKLGHAEGHLRKAVERYPQYAAAWVLLGQVLGASNRVTEARSACAQATTVDSGYTSAYLCLADVAAEQKQWKQALEMADRALALGPAQDVYGYFYTAIAQFHLGQLSEAESNTLQTIDADRFHRVPEAHLLLAEIYGTKHDATGAAAQLRAYLKVAPNSPDSAGVRKKLSELESQTPK